VELLVVIAIIAILAAVLFPALVAVRAAAYQWSADGALCQVGEASILYASDNDDTFMPAMYYNSGGFEAWFGRYVSPGVFDPTGSLLYPYEHSIKIKDPTAVGKNYLGDHSGFGYNWGFIGSDFHITWNYEYFPECVNPATSTSLSDPSNTILFATSAFYDANWLPKGDGQFYDFGFIDPIGYTGNNPNVDFRHIIPRQVDNSTRRITFKGNAIAFLADGHSRPYKVGELADNLFFRDKQN
jgi:type II secretory pathway pseudopilin PulG